MLASPVSDSRPQSRTQSSQVTLHLDDVEVRKALELLSREGSLNILVSPNVTGSVTANIQDMPVDRALAAILKLANLVGIAEGGVVFVYTQAEAESMGQRDRKPSNRVYRLNYVRAADLEKMVMPFLSPEGKFAVSPASSVGIPSQSQEAGGDSLAGGDVAIVQDYEPYLKAVDELVAKIDVQPIQVVIEAVILEVRLKDECELGVNFAVLDGGRNVLTLLGNGGQINASAGFTPNQVLTAGGNVKGGSDGFATDTHGIKFGFVDRNVTGFVRALESVGETRLLASPRLVVLNKQRAELIIGERFGYKTQTVTETASVEKVEFLNVGTQLRLRPFVGGNGMIRMEIHPERSEGAVIEGLPQSSTSEVTTNVLVPDGSTIVVAGLIQEDTDSQLSGVPGLSRLRWVGPLFRQKRHSKSKRELVILLTPHIWNPSHALTDCPPDASQPLPVDPAPVMQTGAQSVAPGGGWRKTNKSAAPLQSPE